MPLVIILQLLVQGLVSFERSDHWEKVVFSFGRGFPMGSGQRGGSASSPGAARRPRPGPGSRGPVSLLPHWEGWLLS